MINNRAVIEIIRSIKISKGSNRNRCTDSIHSNKSTRVSVAILVLFVT
jgi:hypothetical protein